MTGSRTLQPAESRRPTATQQQVLLRLCTAPGFVSGEDLAAELTVSRAAVSKAVEAIRAAGYEIESSPHRGHHLVRRPDLLLPFEVADGLETRDLGRTVVHYRTLASTQPVARSLAEAGAAHGTVVIAEEQTGGRGRLGRAYACPPGGVWCTLILRGRLPAPRAPLVGLAAGIAACEALTSVSGIQGTLKWPNDVLIGGRKVVGVLTEMAAEEQLVHYLLVGVGLNANLRADDLPPDLRATATSLAIEAGHDVSRRHLLQAYLLRLEALFERLLAGDAATVTDAWKGLPNTLGRRVRAELWDRQVEGVACELAIDGALVIREDTGASVLVRAGDVIHIPETAQPAG